MKTIRLKSTAVLAGLILAGGANAQFEFNAQYMGRGEMRHGYSTLADTSQKPAMFVSQRARLGASYKHEKYKINFTVQDVRTWGNTSNIAADNMGYLSIYEANVELLFSKKWSSKIGRQAIAYDDDRIFGSLDWAMQGRRHDAAILKYHDSTWKVDAGFAYNQDKETNILTQYTLANHYKSFQYLWANKQIGKANISFLFLNNGMAFNKINYTTGETEIKTVNTQTVGLRTEYKNDKFNLLGYGYYQMGQLPTKQFVDAYNASVEFGYKPVKGFLMTLGGEILSGTSQIDTANTRNNSFNPLYGTNHRFNGYMDYFYVGNHLNTVGLIDAYLRLTYSMDKFVVGLNGHYFNAAADVRDMNIPTEYVARDSHLGAELDLTLIYKYTDNVSFQGGYSQFFGSPTLRAIRGGNLTANSNWAYMMVIIRPNIKFPRTGLKM